jgi:hypothetical protein
VLDGRLANLGIRLSSLDVLSSLPLLSMLEIFCDDTPDLSSLRDWQHLKVLKLHGNHFNLAHFLQESPSLRSLLVEGSEAEGKSLCVMFIILFFDESFLFTFAFTSSFSHHFLHLFF